MLGVGIAPMPVRAPVSPCLRGSRALPLGRTGSQGNPVPSKARTPQVREGAPVQAGRSGGFRSLLARFVQMTGLPYATGVGAGYLGHPQEISVPRRMEEAGAGACRGQPMEGWYLLCLVFAARCTDKGGWGPDPRARDLAYRSARLPLAMGGGGGCLTPGDTLPSTLLYFHSSWGEESQPGVLAGVPLPPLTLPTAVWGEGEGRVPDQGVPYFGLHCTPIAIHGQDRGPPAQGVWYLGPRRTPRGAGGAEITACMTWYL